MSAIKPAYLTENPSHDAIIDIINEEAFGPGRFARAAERVREQGPHDRHLSFVAAVDEQIVGSVRMTPILAGEVAGHLLGPLAVRPQFKNLGIGRQLVRISVDAVLASGSDAVILVGDAPYYRPLGFEPVQAKLRFPGPVDPDRILVAPKTVAIHAGLDGEIRWRRVEEQASELPAAEGL
ncbi:GNAT family N-acetyltransferase [Hoeflea prorocentri]|uniref:N-acetyltransferase n=1 Tax=Hoeflea prorocentri TaxID=1922333 RepID=A0A9X3UER8_9HYPH|nr:N-acetyltransferase [Hoeflea prorocentri]MCY6379523.1 N-acetyltransferase [Hoeflea prorocentri]MDA5397323.1 N-acetyltransferase [Hoeflea prorocentri]